MLQRAMPEAVTELVPTGSPAHRDRSDQPHDQDQSASQQRAQAITFSLLCCMRIVGVWTWSLMLSLGKSAVWLEQEHGFVTKLMRMAAAFFRVVYTWI